MKWKILIHDAFEKELLHFSEAVQDELMASARMLEKWHKSTPLLQKND